jgi:hypothetical protein
LKEWIEFHKLQGCEHFYLYNNNSTDNFLAVLEPYIATNEVTVIDWPYTYLRGDHDQWITIQTNAYSDCIQKYGKENIWIAFIDVDEFLYAPSGKQIPRMLRRYFTRGGVGAYWRVFGTSGVEELAEHQCLIEALTRCTAPASDLNWWFKSIVRPDCVLRSDTAHTFIFTDNLFTVLTDKRGNEDLRSNLAIDQHAELRINHYWLRTEKHLRESKKPSEAQRGRLDKMTRLDECNQCDDGAILQFVPALRKALGYDHE